MEEPNKSTPEPNNEVEVWADRYRQAYQLLFPKLPQNIKERVLKATNPNETMDDRMVCVFLKDVIVLAESPDFVPLKKNKKEVDSPANPS